MVAEVGGLSAITVSVRPQTIRIVLREREGETARAASVSPYAVASGIKASANGATGTTAPYTNSLGRVAFRRIPEPRCDRGALASLIRKFDVGCLGGFDDGFDPAFLLGVHTHVLSDLL